MLNWFFGAQVTDLAIWEMERRAGIEPASLAWKARVIASIRTPQLTSVGINELDQNAKFIFGRIFGGLCLIGDPFFVAVTDVYPTKARSTT